MCKVLMSSTALPEISISSFPNFLLRNARPPPRHCIIDKGRLRSVITECAESRRRAFKSPSRGMLRRRPRPLSRRGGECGALRWESIFLQSSAAPFHPLRIGTPFASWCLLNDNRHELWLPFLHVDAPTSFVGFCGVAEVPSTRLPLGYLYGFFGTIPLSISYHGIDRAQYKVCFLRYRSSSS